MKLLRYLLLIAAFSLAAQAASYTYSHGALAVSVNAASNTATGDDFYLAPNNYSGDYDSKITWEIVFGATSTQPGAQTTSLEGSIDGTNWYVLDTTSCITCTFASGNAGEMRHVVNKNVKYVRCHITALTIGSAVSETCQFVVTKP